MEIEVVFIVLYKLSFLFCCCLLNLVVFYWILMVFFYLFDYLGKKRIYLLNFEVFCEKKIYEFINY